uniref:Capsule synthesis protein CapA domain-containing protein n=1 Tax=Picocystis salinarum TaxID=88271 RepID=A0A7S3XFP0_9CHLO|mmetsp:Transcript_9842/g.59960  ORF Transcript_9842/g.59960 Transcript_9842/m.59960 type:complete len:460 (+) Transcript_9842:1718-3097(+)
MSNPRKANETSDTSSTKDTFRHVSEHDATSAIVARIRRAFLRHKERARSIRRSTWTWSVDEVRKEGLVRSSASRNRSRRFGDNMERDPRDERKETTHQPGEGTELSLVLLGDVMLGRLIDKQLSNVEGSDERIWGDWLPILQRKHQIVAANLETSVCDHRKLPKMPDRVFNFAVLPQNMTKALSKANVTYVSLANNHVLDFQEGGLLQTIATLKAHGMHFSGAGKSLDEARTPAILTENGVNVAFVSMADHPSEWEAKPGVAGINFIDPMSYKKADLQHQIKNARSMVDELGGGMVVVFAHWGPNWQWKPSEFIVHLGHDMINCGADVVFGHSSHHIMGVEIYHGKPIVYGAGAFLDDYAMDESYRNNLGFLYDLRIQRGRPTTLDMYPSMIHHTWMKPTSDPPYFSSVEKAGEKEARWLRDKLIHLCKDFGTEVQADELSKFSIRIPAHPGFCAHGTA